jgi:CRP-like cAMP-binding protein
MTRRPDPKVGLLRQVPWLCESGDRALGRLAPLVDQLAIAPGEILVQQGAWDRQAFLVVDGQAEVLVSDRHITTVGPGAFVGEMAMLDQRPRCATVRAVTAMRVMVLGPGTFRTFLEQPGVANAMATQLSQRLRTATASAPRGISQANRG